MQNHSSDSTMAFHDEIPLSQSSPKVFSYTVKSTGDISYAAAAQNHQFPKRDQGLLIDCVENLNLTDYTSAVGEIVGNKNILYSTRISNNRVCLYLASKELVSNLIDNKPFIQIGETKVNIRPLISKQQRVIFSNVAPPIPHFVLENILENLNIKRAAPITTLRASIAKDGFNHVLSSRRQTYIDPNDVSKIPDLLKINYEDVTYYVYPSTTTLKCFLCKIEGHIAKHCQNKPDSNEDNSINPSQHPINSTTVNNNTSHEEIALSITPVQTNNTQRNSNHQANNQTGTLPQDLFTMPPPTSNKRPPSSSISTTTENSTKKILRVTKKTKKTTNDPQKPEVYDVLTKLQPISEHIQQNATAYPLNLEGISKFLCESYSNRKIPELARSYTTETASLSVMLQDIHDTITDSTLKSRINRIIKRLKYDIHSNCEDSEYTSDAQSTQDEL